MIYKTSAENETELLNLPEAGMGFQIVSARYKLEYNEHLLLILNGTLIIELDWNNKELSKTEFKKYRKSSSVLGEKKLVNIKPATEEKSLLLKEPNFQKSKGAIEEPIELITKESYFIRVSAYYEDKRIDRINKCLRPGSFTTTLEDYLTCIVNNYDFTERYALPNIDPIQWAFQIAPKIGIDSCQIGVAQPNFDQKGGGKECFFVSGTSFGTFISEVKVTS